MKMLKISIRILSTNIYLIFGIIFGIYLSSHINETPNTAQNDNNIEYTNDNNKECVNRILDEHFAETVQFPTGNERNSTQNTTNGLKPPLIPLAPSSGGQSKQQHPKPVRPRYYSTELGIRDKLFVGIFTSEERINTLATHLNRTLSHLVDKMRFFMSVQYKMKNIVNLTGVVGFSDTRHKFRPFQIIKYIADNYNEFDYYFLANDYTYINGHRLKALAQKISVDREVYLGNRVADSSYCDLGAGILLSNSIIRSIVPQIDWCVVNAISDDHSENLGRCIHHTVGVSCQEHAVQNVDQRLRSFKIKKFDFQLSEFANNPQFTSAVTVYPVLSTRNFHQINAFFIVENLRETHRLLSGFENENLGVDLGTKPTNRFDLERFVYFNGTHQFFADDLHNIRPLSNAELTDLKNIISEIRAKYENPSIEFRRLINGYKKLDLSRGVDYLIDLGFREDGHEVSRRFHVTKPLGQVELLAVPYVTENARICIIVPVFGDENNDESEAALKFSSSITDKKIYILFVLILNNGESKKLDGFKTLKSRCRDDRAGWIEITLRGGAKINEFAVVDLALRKIGAESLVLNLGGVWSEISTDFLNRVRMNTIEEFQIFSPIPFKQFDPKITESDNLDINKNSGYFDRDDYRAISFYGRDYIKARRKFQNVPIFRTDAEISSYKPEKNYTILEMFLHNDDIHLMRAPEMSFKLKFKDGIQKQCNNLGVYANQLQMSRYLNKKNIIHNLL